MAVKEIESALGNKTMNDASKKGLFELLGLVQGVGWRGGRLKREFYKKERERRLAQKRNGRLLWMAARRRKDGMKGKYVREATEGSYSWTSVTGGEKKKMNKGAMNEDDDV